MEYLIFKNSQISSQMFNHRIIKNSGMFQFNRTKLLSGADQFFHAVPVVQFLVIKRLIHINIRIADNADQGLALYFIMVKHFRYIMKDQLFDQHIMIFAGRNRDQTLKDFIAAWDNAKLISLFPTQNDNCIDFFVFQKWEGLFFSDDLWRQKRLNGFLKVFFQIDFILREHIGK